MRLGILPARRMDLALISEKKILYSQSSSTNILYYQIMTDYPLEERSFAYKQPT